MIDGWLQAGRLDEAMAIAETMRARGVQPNTTTVVSLLRGAVASADKASSNVPSHASAAAAALAATSLPPAGKPVEDVLDQLLQMRAPALLRGSVWTDPLFSSEETSALEAAIREWVQHPGRSPLDRDAILQGASTTYPFELPFENAVRQRPG